MDNKNNEQQAGNLDALNSYWALPYALTDSIEFILRNNPIRRYQAGYSIDLGNHYLFLPSFDLEEYLQWLEMAYPNIAEEIRKRVREADEHYFGRNYEAM